MQANVIRGKIIERFGTLTKFATEIGWTPNKVSRVLRGQQELSATDIKQFSLALKISEPSDVVALFL